MKITQLLTDFASYITGSVFRHIADRGHNNNYGEIVPFVIEAWNLIHS